MRLPIRYTLLAAVLPFALGQPQTSSDVFNHLRYRYIGPVGNRVIAAAGIAGDTNTYYVASASEAFSRAPTLESTGSRFSIGKRSRRSVR